MNSPSFSFRKLSQLAVAGLLAWAAVSCSDDVLPGAEEGLIVAPSNLDMLTGDTRTVSASSTRTGTLEVEWSSNAPDVAAVTNAGVVTAVGPGLTTLTAVSVQDRSQKASVAVRVQQRNFPVAGTYDLVFTFDSTRFEVTAPNGGCPTSQGYCTYTRPTGAKSTLSGSMRILDSTFSFTPTFPSGPTRVVSIAEVTLSGRFCSGPDLATPVGCTLFEDVPVSRHTALITRVPGVPPTGSFVRIDSGAVSGDFPTERFLSLTYDTSADSVYGRFQWILHRSVRSPTAQLGSFVARRRVP